MAKAKIEILKRMVPVMVDAAEKITEKEATKIRRSALKKMEKSLDEIIDHLERLKRLGHPIREDEINIAKEEKALKVHISKSRLDLIQFVVSNWSIVILGRLFRC